MRNALIGYTGLVGSHLLRQRSFSHLYNSSNIESISGECFDEVFCAGVSGFKFWANRNPESDLRNINRLLENLTKVRAKKFVLISTIDVYEHIESDATENVSLGTPQHSYGRHRQNLEFAIRDMFEDLLVVRLPGLFGQGLKKNLIYDLIHGNCISAMNSESQFQWYDLENLLRDIEICLKEQLSVINLFPAPIKTSLIIDALFSDKYSYDESGNVFFIDEPGVDKTSPFRFSQSYRMRTQHSDLFGEEMGYVRSSSQVMDDLTRFLRRGA